MHRKLTPASARQRHNDSVPFLPFVHFCFVPGFLHAGYWIFMVALGKLKMILPALQIRKLKPQRDPGLCPRTCSWWAAKQGCDSRQSCCLWWSFQVSTGYRVTKAPTSIHMTTRVYLQTSDVSWLVEMQVAWDSRIVLSQTPGRLWQSGGLKVCTQLVYLRQHLGSR